MQEKVLLNVVPGLSLVDSLIQDGVLESQKTFAEAHRQEIFTIIDGIPSFASSQHDTESRYERFRYLLDLYQEQPSLLDPFIESMINKLLIHIKLLESGQIKFDDVSNVAFKLLAHISKVRGYKVFLSLLPHEMKYMEKVLSSLERYSDSTMDMDSQYILLLWMVILCKNPFDLNKFETKNGRNMLERIITAALPYLYLNTDRCQHSSALLLSLIVSREDARKKYLKKLIDPCISTVENCEGKWSTNSELVGSLRLLAAILKKGEREDLLTVADQVFKALRQLGNLEDSDFTVKKLTVKVVQRLGMVFLKPKIAKWRYDIGNRYLDSENSNFAKCQEFNALEVESFADEVYEVPYDELEVVLNTILEALRDRDTGIRWTGAKGIGRIVSRLPKHLANDVLDNIIKFNFNSHSGYAAWHGGCLAVAELSRRGFLPLERLLDVVKILLNALVFEEPQGHHALGASVRDAACYICWSLARAFRPMDLKKYVEQIATYLVCVALFDREINVRRAASAAFQENVGRQGTFPNGIEVLTEIDYFAVGQRCKSYLEISCKIAKYSMYTRAIIEHLISFKIIHWDEEIRLLSAEALGRLCALDPYFVSAQVLEKLVPLVSSESLIMRQGGVVALASTLSSLKKCGVPLDKELYENVAQIPSMVYPICKKRTRSLGSTLMRRAMNIFIKLLSSVMPREIIKIEDWLSCLELNFSDENGDIRKGACQAGAAFFKLYVDNSSVEFLMLRIRQIYLPQAWNFLKILLFDIGKIVSILRLITGAKVESEREGIAALLSVIPSEVLLFPTSFGPFAAEIIRTLTFTISGSSILDATWAYGRRSCVEAITRIVESVGIESLDNFAELLDCLINSLDDYTMDKRGDVGRVLREETMKAFAVILPLAQNCSSHISEAICKIIQQSVEKIDATRECAALVMKRILQSGLKGIQEEEILRKIYVDNGSNIAWRLPSCFKRLALLLKSSYYRYYALSGFIISAGGVTESTMRGASDALLSVISDVRGSRQELEIFLQCLASILINNAGVLRVTQPLLCTLEQILSAQLLECFEADPDSSPSLRKIVDRLAIEATVKGSAQKIRICISVLCSFLHFNSSSLIWQKSASLIVRTLRSRYPVMRRNAAEQLYECLASECDSSNEDERNKRLELLNLLSKTKWSITGNEQYFVKVSHLVAENVMSSIDVTEILRATTEIQPKRPRIDIANMSTAVTTPEDILAALERDESQAIIVDEAAVKRIVMQLEKRCLKNREMRIKYGDEPAKFMESEVELNEAIQEMHALATQPDLYQLLVDHGATAILLQLLAHENSDIVAAVINLLQELTDVDTLNEGEDGTAKLIDVLVADQLIETLVQQSIERLDETVKDEADAIHNALSVVENVLDFRPSFADICVEQGLFAWLLRRGTQRGSLDANKMFASELLSLLLQSTELARKRLTEKVDGFDLLLRALATYKRHDPGSADEREHMENLFNAVCAALMYAPNRQKFLDGEGLQLMNLMLRERKQSRESALKVLDYATNGAEGKSNCVKFIDILGLRTIFPLFMRTPSKQRRKDSTPDEHEEHVCSVLASLLRSCGEEGRNRIFSKFNEHEYEKVDRAVELVLKYQDRVDRFDARQANLAQNNKLSDDEIEQLYLDKLDAGLYTLQRTVLILADVCSNAGPGCRNRAVKLFQMRTGNGKLCKHLVPILEEYEINLGAEADEERKRIRQLIARLNNIDKN